MSRLKTIKKLVDESVPADKIVRLMAVTKNQSIENISALLSEGQQLFGENYVQEALSKWADLKNSYPNVELHLLGHLQRNKVAEAVALFDVIQTLDSEKLARKLSEEERKQNKRLKYYIEINIAQEPQKSGINAEDLPDFLRYVKNNSQLDIQGIMCIPPNHENPKQYFLQMKALAQSNNLPVVSMGMSEDYKLAIECGSTMVRIGRALFQEL